MKTKFKSRPLLFSIKRGDEEETIQLFTITFENYQVKPEDDGEISLTILGGFPIEEPEQVELVLALRDHLVANFGPGPYKDYLKNSRE